MNFDIRTGVVAQTEMEPGIVAGNVTGLTEERLGLYFSPVMDQNPRANRAAIGLRAD